MFRKHPTTKLFPPLVLIRAISLALFLSLFAGGTAFAQLSVLGLGAHEFAVARQTGSGFQLFEKGFGSRCGVD